MDIKKSENIYRLYKKGRIHRLAVCPLQSPFLINKKILVPKNKDFLCKDYKKDIFAGFSYEFEPLLK